METVRWDTLQTVVLLWLLLLFPGDALQTQDSSTEAPISTSSTAPHQGRYVSSTLVATAPSGYYPRGTGVGSWLELGLFGTQKQEADAAARSGRSYFTETTTATVTTTPSEAAPAPSAVQVLCLILPILSLMI